MRDRASRALGYAVLASLVLHALFLFALPAARELSALVPPPEAEPLIARVKQLKPPPPPAPIRQIRKPEPPRVEPVARPAPAPAPQPEPVPLPPLSAPAEPAPASAPAPLARVEPRLLLPEAPAALVADSGALERYRRDLNGAAARFKRYPRVAIDNSWEGEVVLLMIVGADGRIVALRVKRGSGYEVLDRQALQMFETAKPFVAIPRELRGRRFELELRAIYNLRDQRSG